MFQDYEERRLPVRQNQNENPANPNPPREDPPAADGQGGGRGDGQHIPRADGAEPRQDNPLEQLIGNPLFQAMARAPAVNAVGNCRLPAFWRSDPDLWFLQVEAQFNIHQVTSDSTRFNMILTVLDPETISEVSDIIRAPPAQDKYTTLKDAIVARLTDSPDTQLHKLLGTIELGDKKPSQLLLQMRTLAGARASNDILRVRWLDLLPDSTRRLLTIIKNQTIDELAAVADELHAVGPSVMATEVGRPRSRPASPGGAASSNSNSVGAQEIAELRAAIVQLTEITREALQRRDQPRGRSRSRTQPRSQSRPRSPTPHRGSTEGYCWYHERYGDVAEQCREARACVHTPRPVRKTRCADPSLGARGQHHHLSAASTSRTGRTRSVSSSTLARSSRSCRVQSFSAPRRDGHDRRLPGATSNRHVRTARLCPPSAPRRRSTRSREGRIQEAARSGHHQAFIEPVGQSIAPRAEAWKNTWRITGDYRLLNARTQPDRHPLPIIEDLLQESVGKVFSVVDLYKAFYQIPVAEEEDISKTAVTTPFGLFEFVGMPLGLRNSAQTFQRTMMNYLLRDLDFVRCYQDDILVLSASHEQHLQHLRELLTILKRARLFVNWEKCQIGRSEVVFRRLPHLRARIRATSSQSRSDRSIPEALRLDTAATLYRHAEFLPPMLASRGRAHVSPHGSSPRTAEEKGEACMERSSRRGIRAHQAGYGFSGTISFSTIQASLLLCTPTPRIRLLVPR
ncbi:unnamed protein product [Trichogramma brassicae]|uniref:Uncharacterized protein n=1 Tax=Trichogramma brassicae TaxID=86971 RepID=A0A6H5INJ3_9HYME|nr:unnamed protein product [Trichogramma brassicae]